MKVFGKSLLKFFSVLAFQNAEETKKKQLIDTIGKERELEIVTPKTCIDVMLGAIANTFGARTLEEYIKEMKQSQQTKERIEEVTKSIKFYNDKIEQGSAKVMEKPFITQLLLLKM